MSLNFPVTLCGCPPNEDSVCQYQGSCEVLDPTRTYIFDANCGVIKSNGATSLPQSWGSNQNGYVIYIGSNLSAWGNSLFRSNPRLTEIYVPPTAINCGIYAFWGADDLHTVTFGGSTHNVGAYSFRYCNNLTRVNFCHPGVVKGLNKGTYGAFANCPNLTEVHVPENGWAGSTAYDSRTVVHDLPPYTPTSSDTVAYAADGNIVNVAQASIPYAWLVNNLKVTSITFGTGTTTTGDRAFKNNDNLTSVVIPEWITWIETYCFENCDSLTRVDIPRLTSLPSTTGNPFYKSYPTIHIPVNHPTTATQLGNRPIVKDLPAM